MEEREFSINMKTQFMHGFTLSKVLPFHLSPPFVFSSSSSFGFMVVCEPTLKVHTATYCDGV